DELAVVVDDRDGGGDAAAADRLDLAEGHRRGVEVEPLMGERQARPPAIGAEADRGVRTAEVVEKDGHGRGPGGLPRDYGKNAEVLPPIPRPNRHLAGRSKLRSSFGRG